MDDRRGAPDAAAEASESHGKRSRRRRRTNQKHKHKSRKRRQLYYSLGWLAGGLAVGLPLLAAFLYFLRRF